MPLVPVHTTPPIEVGRVARRLRNRADNDKVAKFGENTPMKRAGQPVELATAYVMLAVSLSSYVLGAMPSPAGGHSFDEPGLDEFVQVTSQQRRAGMSGSGPKLTVCGCPLANFELT